MAYTHIETDQTDVRSGGACGKQAIGSFGSSVARIYACGEHGIRSSKAPVATGQISSLGFRALRAH
ncbi:hypothetical protein N7540_011181 [Penicillium herquei]|nr:hypothetical protein N7540_011181 [Penicillium herquei]